jgi:hypothetical protein
MILDVLPQESSEHSNSVQDHIQHIKMAEKLLDFGLEEKSTTSPEAAMVQNLLKSFGITQDS